MADPQPPSEMPPWQRRLVRLALVALSTALFAAITWDVFRPAHEYLSDFSQDWLSARDVLEGRPAYSDLRDAVRRHLDSDPTPQFLHWNAHPPGSVLVTLPLALTDHRTALLLWNLITVPLAVVAAGLVLHEFGLRGLRNEALAAVAIGLAWVSFYPMYSQVVMGQFSVVVAFLVTAAWAADRNGRAVLAGAAVGLAVAIKLFPAFLLLYFVLAGRWRAAAVAVGVAAALTLAAAAVLGVDAFRTYATEVIPAVTKRYTTQWNNVTLIGFWTRVFDPAADSHVLAVVHAPLAGRLMATATRGAVVALAAWAAWGARRGDVAARDRAFCCATVGMMLVSPIAWPHYYVILLVPMGVLVSRLWGTRLRWPLLMCLLVVWVRESLPVELVYGRDYSADLTLNVHPPMSAAGWLLLIGPLHYTLVGLFVLSLLLPTRDEPTPQPRPCGEGRVNPERQRRGGD